MNRRELLMGSTALVLATAFPTAGTCARLIGAAHKPYSSQKFTGPGWYAFGREGVFGKRVMHAHIDDHWGIALTEGPGTEVEVYISHRAFDEACCGIVRSVEDLGRIGQ